MALPLRITYSSKRTKNLIILTTNFFLSDLHFCNTKTIQWRFGEFDSLCAVVCHSMSMKFHSQKKEEPKNALHFNAFLCASVCVCVHHIYNLSKSSFSFIHMYFGKCLCFSDDAVAVLIFKIFRVFLLLLFEIGAFLWAVQEFQTFQKHMKLIYSDVWTRCLLLI